ncbi:aspartate/glutamate racemase family protein [Candidatus Gottesmanbacteria bacterium]|nr:aspartate/glutamate racemase family protein [Candidatus Gottesmanbacteria bacterium]
MIGIFDSGVGGLSVYSQLKKVLPDVQFIYFADYRNHIKIPVIGLVPAIKSAAKKYTKIAILSTPTTSRSRKLKEYISKFSKKRQVKIIQNSSLVNVVENSDFTSKEIISVCNHLKTLSVDAVVLGCTHFVFLLPYFKKHLPDIEFFDSGMAVAMQTKKIYKKPGNNKKNIFYTTGDPDKFKNSIYSLLRLKVEVNTPY